MILRTWWLFTPDNGLLATNSPHQMTRWEAQGGPNGPFRAREGLRPGPEASLPGFRRAGGQKTSKGYPQYLPECDTLLMKPRHEHKKGKHVAPSRQERIGNVPVSRDEAAWLRAVKRRTGMTWRDAMYRGLGVRREDYLASRNKPLP